MFNNVFVTGGSLEDQEIKAYVDHIMKKNPNRKLESLNIETDGEFVNLSYKMEPVPFERIRRITGYLVGTTDRWNSAKRAEESDRVKHSISTSELGNLE